PLASPDALDPLDVDYPARLAQQRCDLAIAVAAVLLGKLDNIGRQTLLVLTAARDLALRRAMLPERRAGATLGDMQLRSHLLNAGTATRGAKKFPRAASCRMSSPARSLARRPPGATDNTSPRSRRSGGLRPPCSGPVRPKHRPAATSRRSLQACIASLPL